MWELYNPMGTKWKLYKKSSKKGLMGTKAPPGAYYGSSANPYSDLKNCFKNFKYIYIYSSTK